MKNRTILLSGVSPKPLPDLSEHIFLLRFMYDRGFRECQALIFEKLGGTPALFWFDTYRKNV